MGKCDNCGKRIQYNKFKRYRGKILCYDCYDTRLERKRQKEMDINNKIAETNIDDEAKKYGFNTTPDAIAPVEEKDEPTEEIADEEDPKE